MTTTFAPKVGTVVLTSCVFTDTGGVVGDPGVVECKVRTPAGVTTTYTFNPGAITQTGVGMYQLNILATEAGSWTVEWIGSGTGPNVVDCRSFSVDDACL